MIFLPLEIIVEVDVRLTAGAALADPPPTPKVVVEKNWFPPCPMSWEEKKLLIIGPPRPNPNGEKNDVESEFWFWDRWPRLTPRLRCEPAYKKKIRITFKSAVSEWFFKQQYLQKMDRCQIYRPWDQPLDHHGKTPGTLLPDRGRHNQGIRMKVGSRTGNRN